MQQRDAGPPWGFVGVLAVLLLGGAALLFGPGLLGGPPQPSASPAPTLTPSIDPRSVTTGQGTFGLRVDGRYLVVDELAPTSRELGRVKLPDSSDPGASDQASGGTANWTLACPAAAGSSPIRIFFGILGDPGAAA